MQRSGSSVYRFMDGKLVNTSRSHFGGIAIGVGSARSAPAENARNRPHGREPRK
jgi:hypothetical protein